MDFLVKGGLGKDIIACFRINGIRFDYKRKIVTTKIQQDTVSVEKGFRDSIKGIELIVSNVWDSFAEYC